MQTIFASLPFRVRGDNPMERRAREILLQGERGSRLLAYLSRQESVPARGLVLLIHGWEGSSDSTYILSTGRYLFGRGYDIVRLNLRDHGPSHKFNKGLFHGALTVETHNAVMDAAALAGNSPFFVVGFSLGGNFALRVARRHSNNPVPGLGHVFAISPSLNPHQATLSIDRSIYRSYFLKKWKNSLRKKQSLFPGLYDFSDVLEKKTCMAMTEAIMRYYPDYSTYLDYFSLYTLKEDFFRDFAVPVTIIASHDDPIIPPGDLKKIEPVKGLNISIQKYGGHCGFLEPFPFGCWYERKIYDIIRESV